MQMRKDELTSGKVETGIVFEQMLGPDDARTYLRAEGVPDAIIERVLSGNYRRPRAAKKRDEGKARSSGSFYASSGRRSDVVRSCIVQAALALRAQLGNERIARMLRREPLPEDVIDRIVRGEPGTLRARPAAAAPESPADQCSPPSTADRPSA
jgi:hypothetical protein